MPPWAYHHGALLVGSAMTEALGYSLKIWIAMMLYLSKISRAPFLS